jgi:hypothetical protein
LNRKSAVHLLFALLGCGPHPPAATPVAPSPAPLHLAPLADLVPAAGLRWIVDAQPRAFFSNPSVIPALGQLLPGAQLDALARERGGLDLRSIDALVVAGYDTSTLFLAHQFLGPAKLEAAFAKRVADVEGRAIDRRVDDPRGAIVRTWGSLGREHETLVVFGVEAAGLALGSDTPLRAAELFAQSKLRRAEPVWRAAPLDRVTELLGDAPLRAAAPGPFEGVWASGLGGLLAGATAAGGAVGVEGEALRVKMVLTGPWGDRAADAEKLLRTSYAQLAGSGPGRLLGLMAPLTGPTFAAAPDSVALEVRLATLPLLRGLADATTTELTDMMRRAF